MTPDVPGARDGYIASGVRAGIRAVRRTVKNFVLSAN